jgi:hypothetical protein
MGAVWLRDLPDVVADAGLDVERWPDWENRSRSSGGYDALWAVFVHHTASSASTEADCSYMWDSTSGDQPIGALYLARDGLVVVGAAGATNCQGQGGPFATSHGQIPTDRGNSYGLAIEAGNAGTGEPWPTAQTDAYVRLVTALCAAYRLDPARDVAAHFEWTNRKIDTAGPSPWATGTASWDMDGFRRDVAACDEPDEGDEMALSDDDVDRIAERVWARMMTDPPTGKPVTAEQLLGYARHSAANADAQTKG